MYWVSSSILLLCLTTTGLCDTDPSDKNLNSTLGAVGNKYTTRIATVPFFRYFNSNSGDHFYTTNWDELKGGGSNGWIYEGISAQVYPSPVAGTVPLFRYVSKEHFYTADWGELGGGRDGYRFEGIACYIYPSPREGTSPWFRYYNKRNGDHFYTTDLNELGGGGGSWKLEGVAGYVL